MKTTRMGTRPGIAIAATAILALALGATAGATSDRDRWLGLAGGHIGHYSWTVETRPQSSTRPCLLVGTTLQIDPFNLLRSRNRQCAGPGGLSATDPPLVANGVQPSSGGPAEITVIGMIFPFAARRLRVTLAEGGTRTIDLERLSAKRARAFGLKPFRYAAFAARGEWCAERLVSENGRGRVLWDSGTDSYECGTKGPPRFAAP
jgi:hypothetical protein